MNNWYDNLNEKEAFQKYMESLDFNDRLICELNDILGEELN